jgi:hypothetical protein
MCRDLDGEVMARFDHRAFEQEDIRFFVFDMKDYF